MVTSMSSVSVEAVGRLPVQVDEQLQRQLLEPLALLVVSCPQVRIRVAQQVAPLGTEACVEALASLPVMSSLEPHVCSFGRRGLR